MPRGARDGAAAAGRAGFRPAGHDGRRQDESCRRHEARHRRDDAPVASRGADGAAARARRTRNRRGQPRRPVHRAVCEGYIPRRRSARGRGGRRGAEYELLAEGRAEPRRMGREDVHLHRVAGRLRRDHRLLQAQEPRHDGDVRRREEYVRRHTGHDEARVPFQIPRAAHVRADAR